MSSFLEIMGRLVLRDTPEAWVILSRLEAMLLPDCGKNGLQIGDHDGGGILAEFDSAGECHHCVAVESDLAALSAHTVLAAYLTVGWDNIRAKQFFGPEEEVRKLRSKLALEEICKLQKDLLPEDARLAAYLLLE